jgi:hypothetical protein
MPVNAPQEPLELSEAERLRAARRAEREEARRQKKELARIEREMRGPGPRWLLPAVIGGVVLLAVLVFAGYKVWANTVVDNARVPFEDSMEKADIPVMEQYALADWSRVLDLKRRAEEGGGSPLERARLYRQADQLLATTLVAARDASSKVEFVRKNFDLLYEKAVAIDIADLLPDLWKEVEQVKAQAVAEGTSSEDSVNHYRRGVALLDIVSIDFPKIEELRRERASYVEQSGDFVLDDYAKSFPEEAKAIADKLAAATEAVRNRDWRAATGHYQAARRELPAAKERLQTAKDNAVAAIAAFDQALATAKGQDAPRDAQAAWLELGKAREAVEQAMGESRYLVARETAEKGVARVKEMLEQITTARSTLQHRRQEAEEGFRTAAAETAFFAANLAQEWAEVVAAHEALAQAVAKGQDIVSVLELTDALKTRLDAVVARKNEMLAGLIATKDRLAALRANPLEKLLDLNLPKQSEAIFLVSREAQRAEERGDVAQAVETYRQWADLLEKALGDLEKLKRQVMEIAQSCTSRAQKYRVGIERFRNANRAVIDQLSKRALGLIREENYLTALPLLTRLDGLIPEQRFTFDRPGTVCDNQEGLMWASDGKGQGCFEGRQVNWHEAFRWVGSLDFAGYRDWRLPTEDELRLIARLAEAERNRAFPNSPVDPYWTGVPDTDVSRSLAVDIGAARTIVRQKNDLLYVRAVRSPK